MSYSKTDISALYVSIFNRASEGSGNLYWQSQNKSLAEIANDMLNTSDAKEYFGNDLDSNQAFVEHIYKNTLNKTYSDDPEGIQYWTNLLDHGMSRGEVVINMIDAISTYAPGASNYDPNDSSTVAAYNQFINRVEVSNYASDKIYNAPEDYKLKMGFDGYLKVDDAIGSLSFGEELIDGLIESNSKELNPLITQDEYTITLDSGSSWNSDIVTYGFNEDIPSYYYSAGNEYTDGWQELNYQQKEAVRDIVDDLNNYLGIKLIESDNPDIAFNIINMDDNLCGFAMGPGNGIGGDVFLSSKFNSEEYCDVSQDSYAKIAIAHELGHALGLKHPFDGENTLSEELDNSDITIMTYTNINDLIPVFTESGNNISLDYKYVSPGEYSILDIESLQVKYGANLNYNNGDNTYSLSYLDGEKVVLWDTGGVDTVDLSNTTGTTWFDMHDDSLNSVDVYDLDNIIDYYQDQVSSYYDDWVSDVLTNTYNDYNLYDGTDNFAILKGVVIENLYTGSGNDYVADNEVDNIIKTGAGDDFIYMGSGGFDIVDGQEGYDTIVFDINKPDNLDYIEYNGKYIISFDNISVMFSGIEEINFNNDTIFV